MEANVGLFPTVITLAVAVWGAFLATYQWWVAHRERQITLKVWTYWTSTFSVRLQNVSSSPVQIEEIALRGRFLAGLKQRVSRIRDEEFSISHPVTDEGTPLILEPQEAYVYSFDDSWDHLQEYEIARRRHRSDGGPSTLAIRSLVVRIVFGDGRVCESEPYDLYEKPAPQYCEEGHVFVTTARVPASYGPREVPLFLRIISKLTWGSDEEMDESLPLAANGSSRARILDIKDDQALCSELCDNICEREQFSINLIPSHERLVVIVCTALRIVADGGFARFFSDEFPGVKGYDDFPQAFHEIGSDRAAKSLEQALSLFPGGEPHQDIEERRSFSEAELHEKFAEIEGAIRDQPEAHLQKLATYIRENSDAFYQS